VITGDCECGILWVYYVADISPRSLLEITCFLNIHKLRKNFVNFNIG